MPRLRLVAVSDDATHLVLAHDKGEHEAGEHEAGAPGEAGQAARFELPVDERLRAAVRGDLDRLGQLDSHLDDALTPRDIQARIRAGETAAEVARTAGAPVGRVQRFAGPVLAERAHVARTAAQTTYVPRSGADLADPLGDVVAARLEARGVDPASLEWDSWRCEDGSWRVVVAYLDADGDDRRATWSWVPARHQLRPQDASARALVEPDPEPTGPEPTKPEPTGPVSTGPVSTGPVSTDRREQPDAEPEARDADVLMLPQADSAVVGSDGAATADRSEHARDEAPEESEAPEASRGDRPGRRSGRRASVPAWDDIVFGTRRHPDS